MKAKGDTASVKGQEMCGAVIRIRYDTRECCHFSVMRKQARGRRTTHGVRKQHQAAQVAQPCMSLESTLKDDCIWLPCVTLYTLKTCWQRLHPSAKARKKRAQLDMLNTSSRHGWRRTWGGRSSSLPRPPKATETKGEGQERWGNSERSDSGIELLCIFFDFPFKHLEWIEY